MHKKNQVRINRNTQPKDNHYWGYMQRWQQFWRWGRYYHNPCLNSRYYQSLRKLDSGFWSNLSYKKYYVQLNSLKNSLNVTAGDGHVLKAIGLIQTGMQSWKSFKLLDILYVPELSYNLLSIPKATEAGKRIIFYDNKCWILNSSQTLIAKGTKVGSLYYLEYLKSPQASTVIEEKSSYGIVDLVIRGDKTYRSWQVKTWW